MFEVLEYGFVQRSLIAGMIIGVIAPVIGLFLVVRKYSMLADTLAHVSLTGVAIGLIVKINPIVTATVVSVLSVLGIERLKAGKKEIGESVLALFLWGGLATAVVILSLAKGFDSSLYGFLFGSISTVTQSDLWIITVLGVLTLVTVVLFYKELFLIAFDEEQARINGLRVGFLNFLLMVLTALSVSLSIRIVGVILVGALMVIPVMAAIRFRQNFFKTLLIGVGISFVSVVLGLALSYYFDLASGGTIVLTTIFFFILSLFYDKMKG